MAHSNPFDFEGGPIDFASGAFRFLNGTPNVPAMYSARSGYEIINQIGVDAIREKSLRQTRRLMDLADEAGIAVEIDHTMNEIRSIVEHRGEATPTPDRRR